MSLPRVVMKFGGSSVADRPQIDKVLGIVRSAKSRRPLVVSSAHKGVTNALVEAATRAAAGHADPSPVLNKQRDIAKSLGCPPELLEPLFAELSDLLRGLALVRELSARSLDYISSFGERMSTRCIADYFRRNDLPSEQHDVWDLGFITDANHGRARPVAGFAERVREAVSQLDPDVIPIVTGFIGKDESGAVTTVGRNGSDLTASLLGAALGAEEVQIWSDTDGVLTGDPSVVSAAKNIPQMGFDEASELAYFGSRVLHPSTLIPAVDANIPVRVLNTNRPEHPGTVIRQDPAANTRAATSIAYKEGQSVLTISSTRMFGRAGFLAEIFGVMSKHDVVIDMLSTSEVSVSMTSHDHAGLERAVADLRALGDCTLASGRSILVVVGRNMPTRAGLGAEILAAMARNSINVEMLSHAAGSINLTLLVKDEDIAVAVPALHAMLFEAER